MSDDECSADVSVDGSDFESFVHDDDDESDCSVDVFEEFHVKASKRIRVLLEKTEDKIYEMHEEADPHEQNAVDDCFQQWNQGACFIRVRGRGLDIPPADTSIEYVEPIEHPQVASDNPRPPLEICGRAVSIQPCPSKADEEIFAIDGILDEPISRHVANPEPQNAKITQNDEDNDGQMMPIDPKAALIQQLQDALIERLWIQITAQCEPLLRYILAPSSAPARNTLTKPVEVSLPQNPPTTPPPQASSRLQMIMPRQRLIASQFVPVLAARDIDRNGAKPLPRPSKRYAKAAKLHPLWPRGRPTKSNRPRQATESKLPRLHPPPPQM
ncbi:hypothetical protein LEN26_012519 [Aphanomyces euteiches]|nr:hypothetical protein LEN26_012519 [Aphanomyces euteiches]KAH9137844.1 hypothetical protein AeRB84_017641 [Aphanomyces euteiches]